jgi:hypothetical protein
MRLRSLDEVEVGPVQGAVVGDAQDEVRVFVIDGDV